MKQISLDEIRKMLSEGQIVPVRDYVKSIAATEDKANFDHLKSILQSVEDKSIRNAAAIALSDLGGQEAIGPIVALLRDENTRGSRGTLLYALGGLDVSPYLDLLLDFVVEENFEGSHQAFALIRDSDGLSEVASVSTFQERLEAELERFQDKVHLIKELKKLSRRWHKM